MSTSILELKFTETLPSLPFLVLIITTPLAAAAPYKAAAEGPVKILILSISSGLKSEILSPPPGVPKSPPSEAEEALLSGIPSTT